MLERKTIKIVRTINVCTHIGAFDYVWGLRDGLKRKDEVGCLDANIAMPAGACYKTTDKFDGKDTEDWCFQIEVHRDIY